MDDNVYLTKQAFVKDFGELCRKYNIACVDSMDYVDDYPDELVIVNYKDGYRKKCYVTLDNFKNIMYDVINQDGLNRSCSD